MRTTRRTTPDAGPEAIRITVVNLRDRTACRSMDSVDVRPVDAMHRRPVYSVANAETRSAVINSADAELRLSRTASTSSSAGTRYVNTGRSVH